jgi:hypothetical protein
MRERVSHGGGFADSVRSYGVSIEVRVRGQRPLLPGCRLKQERRNARTRVTNNRMII